MLRLVCLVAIGFLASGPVRAAEEVWRALAGGGHVALMRHAQTVPGTGDPPGFRLGDCATQRNLGPEGLAQARRLGDEFRRRGVASARILSSRWCRALDTGRALDLGEVGTEPRALDSFFETPGEREAATDALRALIGALPRTGPPAILVTHQVNITALTGIFPAQGEIVVLALGESGGFRVAGRLPPP